jgi:hypothetical protein
MIRHARLHEGIIIKVRNSILRTSLLHLTSLNATTARRKLSLGDYMILLFFHGLCQFPHGRAISQSTTLDESALFLCDSSMTYSPGIVSHCTVDRIFSGFPGTNNYSRSGKSFPEEYHLGLHLKRRQTNPLSHSKTSYSVKWSRLSRSQMGTTFRGH